MDKFSDIVILCIGTNKLIGDSVGPVVGQKLTRLLKSKPNVKIYGNRKNNLTLKNTEKVIKEIADSHIDSFIITIDAALGPEEMIKTVFVTKGDIRIGEALGNGVECFSNISIKGIVGEDRKNRQENFKVLDKVERKCIYQLSNQIAYDVCQIVETINSV